MAKQARLTSVDELRRFKANWANFVDEARSALMMIRSDISRTQSWLENDRLPYWENMVKRKTKELAQAKNNLHRKEMTSNRIIDEKRAVERAKRHLNEAVHKRRIVKQWVTKFPSELDRLTGGLKQVSSTIDREGPNAAASLEKIIQSVQSYLALQSPTAEITPAANPETDEDEIENKNENNDTTTPTNSTNSTDPETS